MASPGPQPPELTVTPVDAESPPDPLATIVCDPLAAPDGMLSELEKDPVEPLVAVPRVPDVPLKVIVMGSLAWNPEPVTVVEPQGSTAEALVDIELVTVGPYPNAVADQPTAKAEPSTSDMGATFLIMTTSG